MRIGEIAERTGLTISNIRFYEKKGLIGPDREKESKYRNYTSEDLDRLNRIILYRKMDIPVEQIGQILNGEQPAEAVLEQQLLVLKEKQQMLQSSVDLCQKMIDDRAYESMDVTYYLNYVKEEESKGHRFEKIDDFLEDFSTFTKFDRFVGGSMFGWWLFSNRWMNRAAMTLWCAFFLLVPVVGIVDDIMDGNGLSPVRTIFWIAWFVFLVYSFIRFRKVNNCENMTK